MASAYEEEENSLSPYRKLLVDLSLLLSEKEVETLKLAGVDFIPRRMAENIASGLHLFDVLEQDGRIGPRNLNLLQDMLKTVGRVDLTRKIQAFVAASLNGETDEDTFPGNLANHPANKGSLSFNDTEGRLTGGLMAWQDDSEPDGIGDDPHPNDVARSRQGETLHTSHFREMVVFKEGKPSDRELDELAGKIGAKWETLGIRLNIGQDVLEGIDANARDKPYKMLLRWRNTTTSPTPYCDLYHALCHDRVGLNIVAIEFCCFPERLPSSVEYNQLPSTVASQNYKGYNNRRSHTQTAGQVEASQLARQMPLYSADHAGGPTVVRSVGQDVAAPKISYCFAAVGCTSSDGNIGSSSSFRGPSAPTSSGTQTVHQHAGTQGSSSGRIKHFGQGPTRYVDFLACQGYVVEILGGKHFKTPEGEFVEMKSGTQYKIHVKNTHAYGCNLDISIDGYDVGGWVVDGGQEFEIERPVYEAKKFTFYRVKTAPEEAGIESGLAENGMVKCVFTPEAFLNIPVNISGSPLPLDIIIPPSATVGDLKREIQRKLNVSDDPDQVLCSDEKVLLNSDSVRGLPTGNLRFIDTELEITIKTSTKTNFSVKVHPGRTKVRDVMEQIETKLNVPIRDQKLGHGITRLSEAPERGLPYGLICSLQPTLVLIVPEYIHITVEDQNGDLHIIKIDKEKSLRALMEEIPSFSTLQENEEAMFYFNGKALRPSKDEGTLTSLGLCSGSKLELKVNIVFITVQVCFPIASPAINVRCSPQETFKDLVKKLEMEGKKRELEKVIFVMEERVFDPDQDKDPLQEYGITHRSVLEMRRDRAKSNAASSESGDADVSMCKEKSTSLDSEGEFYALREEMKVPHVPFSFLQLGSSYETMERRAMPSSISEGVSVPSARVVEPDPAWRAGGTTLQGYSTQQFMTAEPIKVDPSRRVELVLRLVAREDEEDLVFPKDECKPLSTLCPPPVPE